MEIMLKDTRTWYLIIQKKKNANNAAKNGEPLIYLEVNNPDFKIDVIILAYLFHIQLHDDYPIILKAICILVQKRLTQDTVAKANQTKEACLLF